MARYRQDGEAVFEPTVTATGQLAEATPQAVVGLVVGLRAELLATGLDAGPDTIGGRLIHLWHLADPLSRRLRRQRGEMITGVVKLGWVRPAGLEVAYDRAGDGPPLVLVHSAASDAREWRFQIAGLAGEFTVIAWDEPGAGRSSDVPPEFELVGYGDALAALVETLGTPAHVCGLSWGGVVALELYRRHPELVATLVLADTYAGWKGSLSEHERRVRVSGVERTLNAPARTLSPGLFAGDPSCDVIELLDAIAGDVRPESLRVVLRTIAGADLREMLPRIRVPTLLIWGELDVRSPLGVAHEFADAIPHAHLVVIPGAGHMSSLERPDQFNAAIRAFCC